MSNDFVRIREAAQILGLSVSRARHHLGEPMGFEKLKSGNTVYCWVRSYVEDLKDTLKLNDVKPKPRKTKKYKYPDNEYKPGKSGEFDICPDTGKRIPPQRTFRGSICRHKGCTAPVPTGKLYCESHSHIFDQLKKTEEAKAEDPFILHL